MHAQELGNADDTVSPVRFPSGSSARDLKKHLQEQLGINPNEQRLSVDDTPIFGILPEQPTVNVKVDRVVLDPRLEALLQITGYRTLLKNGMSV